eukprot:6650109-Pyramimonas_sp.AAC.1
MRIPTAENGLLGNGHSPDFAVATWSDGDSWSVPQVSSENKQLASASGKTKGPKTSPDWIKAKDGKVKLIDFKRLGFPYLAVRHERENSVEQFAQQSLRDFTEEQTGQTRKRMMHLVSEYAKDAINKEDLIKNKLNFVGKLLCTRKRPAAATPASVKKAKVGRDDKPPQAVQTAETPDGPKKKALTTAAATGRKVPEQKTKKITA